MKITIFGLTISSSWGNGHATPYRAILRALHELGHEVRFYEKDVPYYARHRDFHDVPYCQLVLYPDWKTIRREAIAHAAESDVVMNASYCPEGAQIADEVLALGGPMKVYYDLDTPVTLAHFQMEGRTEYIEPRQLAGFDLVLSFTGGKTLRRLETDYGARCARSLYGCVDPDSYQRVRPKQHLRSHLSYMGTYAADRQQKLEALFLDPARRSPQRKFLLAGSLYPRTWQWPNNVCKLEHVAPSQHASLYSSSRLTLNITRKEMASSGFCPSGRFFEAAACECPIVSDGWEGLDQFFTHEEIVVVDSTESVIDAMNMSQADLDKRAARARDRTLDEHTGTRRARQFIDYLEEAFTRSTRVRQEVA